MDIVQLKTAEEIRDDILAEIAALTGISDHNLGSKIRTLAYALSLEVDEFYFQLWKATKGTYIKTATGVALEHRASDYGLHREGKTKALGMIRFTGNPGSRIPLGTLIAAPATSAKDEIVFETTQPGIVPPWGSAELPIQAVVAGSEGNLAAQTITYLKQTISGITQVTNPAATVLGSDEEDDASLRERIIRTLQGLSRGTIPAILHGAIDFRLQEVTLKGSLPAGQNYITVAQDLNLFPFSVAGAGKLGLDGNNEVVTYTVINTASFPHKFTGVMRGQQGTSDIDHVDGIKLKEYIPTGHGERVTSASLIETHGHVDVYIDDGTMHGPHAELVSLVQKRLRGDGSDRDPGYRGAGITLDVIARSVVSVTVEVQVVVDFAYDVPRSNRLYKQQSSLLSTALRWIKMSTPTRLLK